MSNEILTTGATASLQSQSIPEADNNNNNDSNNNTESKALTVGTSTSTLSTLPLPLPLANTRTRSNSLVRSRFAECALIEIIHLHDCLRGALWKIQKDVQTLVQSSSYIGLPSSSLPSSSSSSSSSSLLPSSSDATSASNTSTSGTFEIPVAADLSNSVASRFHLIWSVFQAHSGAEDEFIWPALKMKIESKKINKETSTSSSSSTTTTVPVAKCGCESSLEQEEYEEDHALEETMFKQILTTLRRLNGSFRYYHANVNKQQQNSNTTSSNSNNSSNELSYLTIIKNVVLQLKEQTDNLTQHLEQHLKKEETQCLPMVRKHLTDEEISHLVGNIMGKRSAEVMSKILNLAVCSLPAEERDDMVQHMKKAMVGTFFEKWLTMGGWVDDAATHYGDDAEDVDEMMDVDADADAEESKTTTDKKKRKKRNGISSTVAISPSSSIASLPKDSKRKHSTMIDTHPDDHDLSHTHTKKPNRVYSRHVTDSRLRYPSRYYIKTKKNKVVLIWNSLDPQSNDGSSKSNNTIPQFTQSELTPTYHFSETKGCLVLGCEHYTRDCKLRHPITGELYTCRLCCEEIRETHLHGYNDHHDNSTLPQLDRYAVKEVLCMKCGSLQPASQSCVNSECDSYNTNTIHSSSSSSSSNSNSSSSRSQKPFAKYYCSICHLYDDSDKHPIYHCPYCNVCRKGHGLGIDFRHCMRCNACISIDEYAQHVCIPQRLQANCPICHDSMFQSTEPLRGMKCGHVMHLSCFNQYVSRGILGKLKCPLCKSSFDKLRG